MKYKIIILLFFISGCAQNNINSYSKKIFKPYSSKGFALIYSEDDFNKKIISTKLDNEKSQIAHRKLNTSTFLILRNPENNKSIILRVNDRGPFAKDRIIDLSMRAAERLGFKEQGTSKVRVQYYSSAKVYDSSGRVIAKNKYLNNSEVNAYKKKKNSKKTYSLTIGSFKDKKNVERIKKMLKGFAKLKIEKKEKDGVSLFKVLIGPYYRKDYLIKLQETVNIIGITGTKIILNEEK